jgi:hypothetical protein
LVNNKHVYIITGIQYGFIEKILQL